MRANRSDDSSKDGARKETFRGLWKRYGENGVLYDAGKYVDGKKAGVWKYYDPGGKLRRTKTY
jgi:antitoxin component YwqK of YwqJK toxin-antitoxin module